MRVIAIKPGYDGRVFRDPEAMEDGRPVVFEMPETPKNAKPASWYVEVDDDGNPITPIKRERKVEGRAGVPGQGPAKGSQQGDSNPIA